MGRAGWVAALLVVARATTLAAAPPLPPLAPQATPHRESPEIQAQTNPHVTNVKVLQHAPATLEQASGPGSADGTWLESPPPREFAAAVVLDTRRRQLVVYGGSDRGLLQNTLWSLRLDGLGGWQHVATATSLAPPPLSYASAIYDSSKDRMIVFGGQDYRALYNVAWSLSLAGTPQWSLLLPKGPFPPARSAALAVCDSRRNRIIVFGGQSYDDLYFNDVWALTLGDTAQWTKLQPVGTPPAGRIAADGIYDPDSDRVLVHGGFVHTGSHEIDASAELWQLRLSDPPVWERVTPNGIVPPPTVAASAVDDPNHHRMIVTGDGTLSWMLDLSGPPTWAAIPPTNEAPQDRGYGFAALDQAGDRIVVFGGASVDDDRGVDVLTLDPSPSWGVLGGHALPPRRFGQATAYDGRRDQMLVFGGISGETYMNDVWALDLSGSGIWTPLDPYGGAPPPRHEPAGAFDTQRDRMLVYGGWTYPQNFFGDVWSLSFGPGGSSSWQEVTIPEDTKPDPRRAHAVAYDPLRNRLYVFGGLGKDYVVLGDLWALDLNGSPRWIPMHAIGNGPSPRFGHKLIYDPLRDRLLLCGGTVDDHLPRSIFGNYHSTSEAWELPLQGYPVWHLLEPRGYGPRLSDASVIWDEARDRLILYGGVWVDNDVFGMFVDTWALQLEPDLGWSMLSPGAAPPPWREAHSGIYDPLHDRMVVFGGSEVFDGGKNDTYMLDFGGATEERGAWITGSQLEDGRFYSVWATRAQPGAMATLDRSTDAVTWTTAAFRPVGTKGEVSFVDSAPDNAWHQYYRVGVEIGGGVVYSAPVRISPSLTAVPKLFATYPNPSRDGTVRVDYQLPRSDPARLEVLDVRGRLVWSTEILSPGPYVETARAALPGRSGVYFVRLSQLRQTAILKTVLLQ